MCSYKEEILHHPPSFHLSVNLSGQTDENGLPRLAYFWSILYANKWTNQLTYKYLYKYSDIQYIFWYISIYSDVIQNTYTFVGVAVWQ